MVAYNVSWQGTKKEKQRKTHTIEKENKRYLLHNFSPNLPTVQGILNLKISPNPMHSSRPAISSPTPVNIDLLPNVKTASTIFPQIWRSLKHSKSKNFHKPSALIMSNYRVADTFEDRRRGDHLHLASSHLQHQFHQISTHWLYRK
ncbi:Hypothetical predicted protein, partial [Olea europaea subsp. europaea]